jgi:hypothetical protein
LAQDKSGDQNQSGRGQGGGGQGGSQSGQGSNQSGGSQGQEGRSGDNSNDAEIEGWRPGQVGEVQDESHDGRLKENRMEGKTLGTTKHAADAPHSIDKDEGRSTDSQGRGGQGGQGSSSDGGDR